MKAIHHWSTLCLLVFVCGLSAETTDIQFTPNAYTALEFGQIVKGMNDKVFEGTIDHQWKQRLLAGAGFNARLTEQLSLVLAGEMALWHPFPRDPNFPSSHEKTFSFYLHQAEGRFLVGDEDAPVLEAGWGYFPCKYNPDVKNLGEYLFRSGTYPQYLLTEADFPFARLLGLRVGNTLFPNSPVRLDHELLITSSVDIVPLYDVSFSYLQHWNLFETAEVGWGVSLADFLSVDESLTTPEERRNAYLTDGDTAYYTFRGIKLMGRLAFDPKALFDPDGFPGIFGEQDLRFYTEAAVLGVKDYPVSMDSTFDYNDITERIPVVVGFNLPGFRIIDVLSIEAERFGSEHPNDMYEVYMPNLPIPGITRKDSVRDFSEDDLKWSVYGKKMFGEHVSLTALFANDHIRTVAHSIKTHQDFEETLRRKNHWHYMIKVGIAF